MHIILFQPRYPYGKGQTYLPGGLMNLGSRLLWACVEVTFVDLNYYQLDMMGVRSRLHWADAIGFSVLGPPYIPSVAESIVHLRSSGYKQPILLGGEGVARLTQNDFQAWFGEFEGVTQITDDCAQIETALGLAPLTLHSGFATSMVPMLERLNDYVLRDYLTQEFPLFLSNGCKFNCGYCAAAKAQPETYRTVLSLEDEVKFICQYLRSIDHPRFTAYLSNLDICQNPRELEARLSCIYRVAGRHGIEVCLRGLATSRCTVEALRQDPEFLRRIRSYGVRTIGIGADGVSEETWRRENKKHNKMSEIMECIHATKEADILIELLMVIGFRDDKPRNLWADLKFSFAQAFGGAVIRPYLAKSKTPSAGERWVDDDPEVKIFRDDRSLLTRLDYAMLGSKETHPWWMQRWLSNAAYLLLIASLAPFGLCPTRPLVPVPQKGIGRKIALAVNKAMPFDR